MDPASGLRWAVWNDAERRPRAGWRVLAALVALAVAAVTGTLAGAGLAALAPSTAPPAVTALVDATAGLLVLVAFVVALLAAAWGVDRRRLSDLGLGLDRRWWRDLGFGLALGVALPALVFALEWALGWLTVTGVVVTRAGPTVPVTGQAPAALAFALTAGYFLGVGLFEELLFRGYLLTNAAEGLAGFPRMTAGRPVAVATLLTSVPFGLAHAANPNATALGVVIIVLYGGFLAAGYLLTGDLAIPVGFHAAWNLAISSVFGFPVSGVATPVTLLAVEQSGPALLTGGRFGPEAGLVSLVALVAGVGALVAWVRWHGGGLAVDSGIARPALRDSE